MAVIMLGCASDGVERTIGEPRGPDLPTALASDNSTPAPTTTAPAISTTTTTTIELAFNGRVVPNTPSTPSEAVDRFIAVERLLRNDETDPTSYPDLGHEQQVIVRTIARNPAWHDEILSELPLEFRRIAELHLKARAQLGELHTAPPLESIPAWEIVDPEPMSELVAHSTGIEWEILAAINLIETGMGRIDGLSSAGAQGPMQFLPSTWDEVSEGGDINSPRDAIGGAARYLLRRGANDDIRQGLWGYNNSDSYVNAVLAYAELLRLDDRALRGLYNWEIYVGTVAGTLWLPVGFRTDVPLDAATYQRGNPWASTRVLDRPLSQ